MYVKVFKLYLFKFGDFPESIFLTLFFFCLFQAGLELKENMTGAAPWPYGYPYPYDPTMTPYAFNG